jgi:hypothetical protein
MRLLQTRVHFGHQMKRDSAEGRLRSQPFDCVPEARGVTIGALVGTNRGTALPAAEREERRNANENGATALTVGRFASRSHGFSCSATRSAAGRRTPRWRRRADDGTAAATFQLSVR